MEGETVSGRTLADDVFSVGGLTTALEHGCRIAVDAVGVAAGTYLTAADLCCSACGVELPVPGRRPASYLAYNARYNDGLCAACVVRRRTLFAAAVLSFDDVVGWYED